jgi:DnaJ-domain-containing protein 1
VILTALLLRFSTSKLRTRKYLRALEAGDLSLAGKILKLGIHPQAALSRTIELGSFGLLQKLIFSGVHLRANRPNTKTDPENPLKLALASSRDSQEKLRLLVSSGAVLDGLLVWSIVQRDQKFFDFLIRSGANIHAADRNGLTPLATARMLDEAEFEKTLLALGAKDDADTEKILEHLVINENLFLSELHQLILWCIKNSGFRLTRVTLPREQTLSYRIQSREVSLRIELALLPDQQITLFIFKEEERAPFSTLLPFAGNLDSKTLRGHVVTLLKEIEAAIQNGTFKSGKSGKSERAKTSTPLSPEAEKALQTLGLSAHATEQEIIQAYRTLAKRYHPDLAKAADQSRNQSKMSEINRAYEKLRK